MNILKYLLIAELVFYTSCHKTDPPKLPVVSSHDVSQSRTTANLEYEFVFNLDKKTSSDVSFQYATQAGTAEENKDFVPVSGTFTIPAGSETGSIKVTVIGDSIRKANQVFLVKLSEPKNGTLQTDQV